MLITTSNLIPSSPDPNKIKALWENDEIKLETPISELRDVTHGEKDIEYRYKKILENSPDKVGALGILLEEIRSTKASYIDKERNRQELETDPKGFIRQFLLEYGYYHCLDGSFAILGDFDEALEELSNEIDLKPIKDHLIPFGLEAAVVGYSIAKYEVIISKQLKAFEDLEKLPSVTIENANLKIALLSDLGVLDKLYFDHDENASLVSRIIGTITDLDPETVRKLLEAFYKPNPGNKKNNPFNNRETKLKLAQIKSQIGLK